jgi:hypothetical protein
MNGRHASHHPQPHFQKGIVKIAFKLRFSFADIGYWAERYNYDENVILPIVASVKRRGFLTKKEFLTVCRWKTPRSQPHCQGNSPEFIREITKCALSTPSERLRIEVLTLLNGVSWPTASVMLHFFHADSYPILDFRALWSLKTKVPLKYEFDFWVDYTGYCRRLSKRCAVSMRTLDRALWQFSKENQP